jgi:HEAT repeat protein
MKIRILAALVLVVVARAAVAEDPPAADPAAQVADLEARVAKDAAAKDEGALAKDAAATLETATRTGEPGLRTRLVAVAGRILDASAAEATQQAAIQALGRLLDSAGFDPLRRFLGTPTLDGIHALGKIRSDDSVGILLAIVDRARDPVTVVVAMQALAGFGDNKGVRARIVAELVASVRKHRPMPGYRRPLPAPPSERYEGIAGEMAATLNRLTRQNVASPEDWFDLAEKYKANLEALFAKPPATAPAVVKASPAVVEAVEALERESAVSTAASDLRAIESAVAIAGATLDPAMRTRLADVVGKILGRAPSEDLDHVAVRALGEIGDPQSFRFLRPRFHAWEGSNGLQLEAIAAAGAIRSPRAVPLLLALVENGDTATAVAALKALASFRRDPEVRQKVVLGIVAVVQGLRADPSIVPRPPPCIPWPEGDLYERYAEHRRTIASEMTTVLNAMTGRDLASSGAWYDLVEEHRENPAALFLDK